MFSEGRILENKIKKSFATIKPLQESFGNFPTIHFPFLLLRWSVTLLRWSINFVGNVLKGKFSVELLSLLVLNSSIYKEGVSLMAQTVKNLPVMEETWVWSLDWEDPLEKGMITHSSILTWRIPWTEEPGWLQSIGSQRVGHHWATKHTHTHTHLQGKKKKNWTGGWPCIFLSNQKPHTLFKPSQSPCVGTIWASVCMHKYNSYQWFLHHLRNMKVFILAKKQPGVRSVSTSLLISSSPWRECSFKST